MEEAWHLIRLPSATPKQTAQGWRSHSTDWLREEGAKCSLFLWVKSDKQCQSPVSSPLATWPHPARRARWHCRLSPKGEGLRLNSGRVLRQDPKDEHHSWNAPPQALQGQNSHCYPQTWGVTVLALRVVASMTFFNCSLTLRWIHSLATNMCRRKVRNQSSSVPMDMVLEHQVSFFYFWILKKHGSY